MHNFVVDPHELTTLRSVLDEYCAQHLVVELSDRDECARQILALFSAGVTSRDTLLDKMNAMLLRTPQNAL